MKINSMQRRNLLKLSPLALASAAAGHVVLAQSPDSTTSAEARELSAAVRKSETVALRHPIVPVADGLSG